MAGLLTVGTKMASINRAAEETASISIIAFRAKNSGKGSGCRKNIGVLFKKFLDPAYN